MHATKALSKLPFGKFLDVPVAPGAPMAFTLRRSLTDPNLRDTVFVECCCLIHTGLRQLIKKTTNFCHAIAFSRGYAQLDTHASQIKLWHVTQKSHLKRSSPMAISTPKPAQQTGGTAPAQQQGKDTSTPQQQGQTVFRDWASI